MEVLVDARWIDAPGLALLPERALDERVVALPVIQPLLVDRTEWLSDESG
jgi:hypothetical protein